MNPVVSPQVALQEIVEENNYVYLQINCLGKRLCNASSWGSTTG